MCVCVCVCVRVCDKHASVLFKSVAGFLEGPRFGPFSPSEDMTVLCRRFSGHCVHIRDLQRAVEEWNNKQMIKKAKNSAFPCIQSSCTTQAKSQTRRQLWPPTQ